MRCHWVDLFFHGGTAVFDESSAAKNRITYQLKSALIATRETMRHSGVLGGKRARGAFMISGKASLSRVPNRTRATANGSPSPAGRKRRWLATEGAAGGKKGRASVDGSAAAGKSVN